jgi:protein-tyrosine-phosphatase
MKILFVCRANVARSQIAQAAFELLSRHETASAGTHVDDEVAEDPWARRKVKDWSHHAVPYMLEHGVDIGERERTQLTTEMAAAADRVVVILPRSEWPDYLAAAGNTIEWNIPDPGDMPQGSAWLVLNEVRRRVLVLVGRIG